MGLPFFQGKADFGETSPVARKWCTNPKKIADNGDILISVRAPVGPTNIASERCCIGRGLAAIRPDGDVALRDFVRWAIVSRTDELIRKAQGSTFEAIGQNDLKSLRVPLPPLAEQRRIAGILNRAAHIQRLRARATDHLRSLVPALFAQTFGDPAANPMGWPLARLGDVAAVAAAGDPAPQEPEAFASDGPLFVRMQDVGRGRLNPVLSTSADRLNPAWLSRHRLRLFPENSILIPKSGASINLNHRAMLATAAHVVSHLAVLIPNRARVEPDWLFWWSVHYDPRERAQVTSLPSLKLATLKEAPVPLPPLAEQRRFATVAGQAQRMTRAAETATATARALAASLMDRLLNPNPPP